MSNVYYHVSTGTPMTFPQPEPPQQIGATCSRMTKGKRKITNAAPGDSSELPIKSKKDQDPNWSPVEICVLIDLKKDEWLKEQELQDSRERMQPDGSRWNRIVAKLNHDPVCQCEHNTLTCSTSGRSSSQNTRK